MDYGVKFQFKMCYKNSLLILQEIKKMKLSPQMMVCVMFVVSDVYLVIRDVEAVKCTCF